MFSRLQSFTVVVDTRRWSSGPSTPFADILMGYLEDVASGLDFSGRATACRLNDSALLWFTFDNETDSLLFMKEIQDIARDWDIGNDRRN